MPQDTYDRPALISELIRDENDLPYVYDDATGSAIVPGYTVRGNPTLGIGRTVGKGKKGLSPAERILLCMNDAEDCEAELDSDPNWTGWWRQLDAVRQRALVNLAFNLGQAGLDEFHTFRSYVKIKAWAQAGTALQESKWWGQVGQRGPRIQHMIVTGTVPVGEPAAVVLPEEFP